MQLILQLLKTCKMEKMRSAVRGLNAAILANAEYVVKERRKLDCSPKDTAVLDKFMSSKAEHAKVVHYSWRSVFADVQG